MRTDESGAPPGAHAGGLSRRQLLVRAGAGALAASIPGWRALGAGSRGDPRLRALAAVTKGRLLTPASPGYGSARLPVNARYDGIRPLAILQAANAQDVRQAMLWARRNNVAIAARSGGHSYAGYSSTRGLLVELGTLDQVLLRSNGTALVGAGTRLIDMYQALANRGRVVPGGSCPTVGVGGLALGGGVGFSGRAFGTTSDNIVGIEIVTTDGRIRNCDARNDADLLWACQGGGGGNFGIVTRFRFQTHPVGGGSYFFASFPWDSAEDVVARWQRWAPEGPDELFSILSLSSGETLNVLGQYLGPRSSLQRLLRDLTRVASPATLQVGSDDFLDLQLRWAACVGKTVSQCAVVPHLRWAAKSQYVDTPLPARGIATLVSQLERPNAGSILMDSYGGAINRVKPSATAFVHRDNLFSYQFYVGWSAPSQAASSLAWLRGAARAVRPWSSGFAYQNYIDPDLADWPHAYYGSNLPRLVQVKRKYDADGILHFAQGIRPGLPGS
jgi:FAD/FMN-containing dehydrogenase